MVLSASHPIYTSHSTKAGCEDLDQVICIMAMQRRTIVTNLLLMKSEQSLLFVSVRQRSEYCHTPSLTTRLSCHPE